MRESDLSPSEEQGTGVPMLDFYRLNAICPVTQDISDYRRHVMRRDDLFRSLGIVPAFLRDRRVIEFGPGAGYNSLHLVRTRPAALTLVDGNDTSLRDLASLFEKYGVAREDYRLVRDMYLDYPPSDSYDLVLCEGSLDVQPDPVAVLRHLTRFVAVGGLLVVSCSDPISVLPEIMRRVMARLLVGRDDASPIEVLLAKLRPIFADHFASLASASRLLDDWLVDVLLGPHVTRFICLDECISIGDAVGFDFLGSSPRFFTDWRWYKAIGGQFNADATEQYLSLLHCLMDYREFLAPRLPEENLALRSHCAKLVALGEDFVRDPANQLSSLAPFEGGVETLAEAVAAYAPRTATALGDFTGILKEWRATGHLREAREFRSLFGRGQQYVSLLRRDPT